MASRFRAAPGVGLRRSGVAGEAAAWSMSFQFTGSAARYPSRTANHGLGLYGSSKKAVGGVGVSGDTSCTDHNIAWRVRHELALDNLFGVGGVSGDPSRPDNIVFDLVPNPGGPGHSAGGFGHPTCSNTASPGTLPVVR